MGPIMGILEEGPVGDETLFEFKGRFQGLAYDYIEGVKDVVGGVQEEREPGNDPGDDEDRTCREDERPGLRGGGETLQDDGVSSEQTAERSEGVSRQPASNDGVTNEDSRDDRRILRRRWYQRWSIALIQAGRRRFRRRNHQTTRLRRLASKSQETGRKARQRRDQTATSRERG